MGRIVTILNVNLCDWGEGWKIAFCNGVVIGWLPLVGSFLVQTLLRILLVRGLSSRLRMVQRGES